MLRRTKSARSGLIYPVPRIQKSLIKGKYAKRCGYGSAIFLTAVLEYLSCEILELSKNAAVCCNRKTISPRHILLAIRNDEELNKLLGGVVISMSGVVPHIHKELVPTKPGKTSQENNYAMSQEY
ncbi:hypothetical protein ACJJTC_002563 [Scirpophaga incertulas]